MQYWLYIPGVLPSPSPSFRYLAGDPSLDLVNTVDWSDQGLTAERLHGYSDLLEWAEGAALLEGPEIKKLQRYAATHPKQAARVLADGLRLRQLIRSVAIGVARHELDEAELERFNGLARKAQSHRRLMPPTGRMSATLKWGWESTPSLELPLWAATLAASSLLSSAEAGQVRVCQGPNCGWMYVDRSRNGLRRWCAMDMCGGREKARRHYARVKQSREK